MENQLVESNPPDDRAKALPVMTDIMTVQMVVSHDDQVWILHDKPFEGVLHWIEYDTDFRSVTMVMRDGSTQNMGVTVNDEIAEHLRDGTQVYTLLTEDNKIKDMYMVPIVVRY